MSQAANPPLHLAGEWDVYPAGGTKMRLRYFLKQTLFFLFLHCGYTQMRDLVLALLGRSRVLIVFYHRVGWIDFLSKPTGEFRAEVKYLARHYECLSMRDLVERLQSGVPIRHKIAVITFDDGYRDNYLSAFPELKRAGIPGTFFVSTGYIGTRRTFPHDHLAVERGQTVRDDWEKLSWDEIREMQAGGMEIGSHTVEHARMSACTGEELTHEVRDSLAKLQQELGPRPRCFCFPWGRPEDTSEEAVKELRSAGYYAAVTTTPGLVQRKDHLFQLRRIDVGNGHYSRLGILATIEGFGWGRLARHLRS